MNASTIILQQSNYHKILSKALHVPLSLLRKDTVRQQQYVVDFSGSSKQMNSKTEIIFTACNIILKRVERLSQCCLMNEFTTLYGLLNYYKTTYISNNKIFNM